MLFGSQLHISHNHHSLHSLEYIKQRGVGIERGIPFAGRSLLQVFKNLQKITHAVWPLVDEDHPDHQVLRQRACHCWRNKIDDQNGDRLNVSTAVKLQWWYARYHF